MTPAASDDTHAGLLATPTRHPRSTLVIAVLTILLAIACVRTMNTDSSLSAMLPEHDSSSAALAQITQRFETSEQVTLIVTLPDKAPTAPHPLVAFAKRFQQALAEHPDHDRLIQQAIYLWPDDAQTWAREVVPPNLVLYLDQEGRDVLRQRLTPQGMADQFQMNERVAAAPGVAGSSLSPLLEDPLRLRELVQASFNDMAGMDNQRPGQPMLSMDKRSLLIRVTPTSSSGDAATTRQTMDLIRQAIKSAEPGGLNIAITGGPAIAETAERTIRSDMIISSIGTVVLLQLLFVATYRRFIMFPIAFLPAAGGVLVGFGIFALTGRSISPPTAVIGALLAGLGIDYTIHFLAHTHSHQAIATTSRRLITPLAMACVTSVIAFATIGLADVAALRDFAIIGAIGLTATLIATLTLLPALLTLLSRRFKSRTASISEPRWHLNTVIQTAVRQRRIGITMITISVIAAALLLALLPGGPVRFDTDLTAMHPQPNAPLDAQQQLNKAFPGQADTLLLYITARSEAGLIESAAQSHQRLTGDVTAQRYVAATFGIDRLLPTRQNHQDSRRLAESIDAEKVQADFDAAVDHSLFTPDSFTDYRTYLGNLLKPGKGPTLDTLQQYPGLASGLLPRDSPPTDKFGPRYDALSLVFLRRPIDNRDEREAAISAIRAALADVPGVTLTGIPVVGHDVEASVRSSMPRLLLVAAAAVAIWLLLCFRSPGYTAMALLPVSAGMIILFGVLLLAGVGLNLLNLVALPLLAGLGVDDGVFLVSIARDARKHGLSRKSLITDLAASSQAITLTSATTALAFGSLIFTGVPAIRSLGIVMAVGIVACLLTTVFALAPLLVMTHGRRPGPAPDHGAAA